jgi:inner membrane protein COX18
MVPCVVPTRGSGSAAQASSRETPIARRSNLDIQHTMLPIRILRPPGRQLLYRAPIISHKPLSGPRIRAFHATAPRKDGAIDAFLYLPHEMLSLLHNYVPWYATIPLVAFFVRGLLVTTAGSYARALTARYIGTHPVRQAIAYQKRNELMMRGGYSNPKEAQTAIAKAVKAETTALDKRWNCTIRGQLSWTIAQIPIFFTMAEVIRQMCGTRDGLLGLVLGGLGLKGDSEQVHGIALEGNQWFQASLAQEGMLWFPNLLTPDPFLPFVVSALMFTNVYMSKNKMSANPDAALTVSTTLRRVLLLVSLIIGPACQGLPAALMLYWASSTSSVMLWNVWLDRRYPSPQDFKACRRPLQLLGAPKPTARIAPGLGLPMAKAKTVVPKMQGKRRQRV